MTDNHVSDDDGDQFTNLVEYLPNGSTIVQARCGCGYLHPIITVPQFDSEANPSYQTLMSLYQKEQRVNGGSLKKAVHDLKNSLIESQKQAREIQRALDYQIRCNESLAREKAEISHKLLELQGNVSYLRSPKTSPYSSPHQTPPDLRSSVQRLLRFETPTTYGQENQEVATLTYQLDSAKMMLKAQDKKLREQELLLIEYKSHLSKPRLEFASDEVRNEYLRSTSYSPVRKAFIYQKDEDTKIVDFVELDIVEKLQSNIGELKQIIDNSREEIQMLQVQYKDAVDENELKSDKCSQLQLELDKLELQIVALGEEKLKLKRHVDSVQKKYDSLKAEHQTMKSTNANSEQNVTELNNLNRDLSSQINKLQNELELANVKYNDLADEKQELEKDIVKAKKNYHELYDQMLRNVQNQEAAFEDLANANNEVQRLSMDLELCKRTNVENAQIHEKYQLEIEKLKQEGNITKLSLVRSSSDLDELSNRFHKLQLDHNRSFLSITALKEEMNVKEQQNLELLACRKEQMVQLDSEVKTRRMLESSLSKLQNEYTDFKRQFQETQDTNKIQIDNLKNVVFEKNESINVLKSELMQLQNRVNEYSDHIIRLEKQLSQVTTDRDRLLSSLSETSSVSETLIQLQGEKDNLGSLLSEYASSIEASRKENSDLQQKLQDCERKIVDLKNSLDGYEVQNTQLSNNNSLLKAQIAELRKEINDQIYENNKVIETKSNEIQQLRDNIANMQLEESLKEANRKPSLEIEQLKTIVENLSLEKKNLNDQLQDLLRENETLLNQLQKQPTTGDKSSNNLQLMQLVENNQELIQKVESLESQLTDCESRRQFLFQEKNARIETLEMELYNLKLLLEEAERQAEKLIPISSDMQAETFNNLQLEIDKLNVTIAHYIEVTKIQKDENLNLKQEKESIQGSLASLKNNYDQSEQKCIDLVHTNEKLGMELQALRREKESILQKFQPDISATAELIQMKRELENNQMANQDLQYQNEALRKENEHLRTVFSERHKNSEEKIQELTTQLKGRDQKLDEVFRQQNADLEALMDVVSTKRGPDEPEQQGIPANRKKLALIVTPTNSRPITKKNATPTRTSANTPPSPTLSSGGTMFGSQYKKLMRELREEIIKLKQRNVDLAKQIMDIAKQKELVHHQQNLQMQQSEREIQRLTEQLRQDKNLLLETEELKKKLNEAEQRIKEISELNAKLCKDLEVSKKTIEEKKAEISKVRHELTQLSDKVKSQQEKDKRALRGSNAEVERLKSDLQKKEKSMAKIAAQENQTKLKDLLSEKSSLEKTVALQQAEIEKLLTNLNEVKQRLEKEIKRVNELERKQQIT